VSRHDRWSAWWFGAVSPAPLAAFRILFGAYLFVYFASFVGAIELKLSSEGVYLPLVLAELAPGPHAAWAIHMVLLAATAAFTVGCRSGLAAPVVLALYGYEWILHLGASFYAYDRLNLILLSIACFANLDGAWALRRDPAPVAAWGARLIRLEIAVMYFGSGVYKALNPLWHDGQILFFTWTGAWGTDAAFWIVQRDLPMAVYTALVLGVVAFEIALAPLLLWRRTAWIAIALGTGFHLANWVLLDIPEFMACVATYPLFVPPGALESFTGRVRGAFAERPLRSRRAAETSS
jgi:vitamin K-dependent gamma-carboxylase